MEVILETITQYGLETVIIALLINILTGLFKLPIKKLAGKLEDYTKISRFIVFLPIAFGFGLTICYEEFILHTFSFNREFYTLWITSSSLSLTFFAIFEKIFPSKKKMMTASEKKTTEYVLGQIQNFVQSIMTSKESIAKNKKDQDVATEKLSESKIVLKGNANNTIAEDKNNLVG